MFNPYICFNILMMPFQIWFVGLDTQADDASNPR